MVSQGPGVRINFVQKIMQLLTDSFRSINGDVPETRGFEDATIEDTPSRSRRTRRSTLIAAPSSAVNSSRTRSALPLPPTSNIAASPSKKRSGGASPSDQLLGEASMTAEAQAVKLENTTFTAEAEDITLPTSDRLDFGFGDGVVAVGSESTPKLGRQVRSLNNII